MIFLGFFEIFEILNFFEIFEIFEIVKDLENPKFKNCRATLVANYFDLDVFSSNIGGLGDAGLVWWTSRNFGLLAWSPESLVGGGGLVDAGPWGPGCLFGCNFCTN